MDEKSDTLICSGRVRMFGSQGKQIKRTPSGALLWESSASAGKDIKTTLPLLVASLDISQRLGVLVKCGLRGSLVHLPSPWPLRRSPQLHVI